MERGVVYSGEISTCATVDTSEEDSKILNRLNVLDVMWQRASSDRIQLYHEKIKYDEQNRKFAEEQAQQALNLLYGEQLKALAEQQAAQEALDEKVKNDAMLEQSGLPVGGGAPVQITKEEADRIKESIGLGSKATETQSVVEQKPSEKKEGTVDTTNKYLGQFTVKFLCSCGDCFVSESYPGVSVGECVLIADKDYADVGKLVKLNEGYTGLLMVKDGEGLVSGRNAIALINNHSHKSLGKTLYPKITIN